MTNSTVFCTVDPEFRHGLLEHEARLICRSTVKDGVAFYVGKTKTIRNKVVVTGFGGDGGGRDVMSEILKDSWSLVEDSIAMTADIGFDRAYSISSLFFHCGTDGLKNLSQELTVYVKNRKTELLRARLKNTPASLPERPVILNIEKHLISRSCEMDGSVLQIHSAPSGYMTFWPKGNTMGYGPIFYLIGRDINAAILCLREQCERAGHEFRIVGKEEIPVF